MGTRCTDERPKEETGVELCRGVTRRNKSNLTNFWTSFQSDGETDRTRSRTREREWKRERGRVFDEAAVLQVKVWLLAGS